MQIQHKRQAARLFWLFLLAGGIPSGIVLATTYGISAVAIMVFSVVMALVAGTLLLWQHANAHATGSEWWQDENASGWRGY